MFIKEKILFSKEECNLIKKNFIDNTTNWNKIDRKYKAQPINYSENTKWIFEKLKNFFEDETKLKIIKMTSQVFFSVVHSKNETKQSGS